MAGKSTAAKPSFYPLSPLQQGMLFHCLESPGAGLYHEQAILLLEGDLDLRAFERAWARVIERHEALRTMFAWRGLKQPVQVVRPRLDVPLKLVDLRAAAREGRSDTAWMQQLSRAERGWGFDLERAPLWRLTLVRLPEVPQLPEVLTPEPARPRWGLLWSFSHLLLDGWSVPLVWQEAFRVYLALAANQIPPTLPKVPPFRRYIAWLYKQDTTKAEAWWRRRLAGLRRPLRMAEVWGEPRRTSGEESPETPTFQVHRLVPAPEVARLRQWGRSQGLTLNTLVQAAWALLASRYVGHDDVVFGIVVSGRPSMLPAVERMVGMFINTVPLRVEVPAPQAVTSGRGVQLVEWLAGLQRQAGELQPFEHTPLAQIQSWSELPAREALFDFLLVFENQPRAERPGGAGTGGLQAELLTGEPVSNYPLTLAVTPPLDDGHALHLHLTAHRDRVEERDARRLLGHLETLLLALSEAGDVAPAWLPMLAPAERRAVLQLGTAPSGLDAQDVVARVLSHARQRPQAVALSFVAPDGVDHHLSYGRLDAVSQALAERLRRAGVGPEVTVALMLPRGLDLALAMLAVLRAGGAYVPLDLSQPAKRLEFVLEDCGAAVVVGQAPPAFQGRCVPLPPSKPATVTATVDTATGDPLELDETAEAATWPSALAYLIYTSGTTGIPKGVEVRRRNLSSFLDSVTRAFELRADDRLPCLAPHGFDIFGFELWGPLSVGGTAVLMPLEPILDLDALVRRLPTFSRLHAVPALLGQLLDRLLDRLQDRRQQPRSYGAGRLRTIFTGGDLVPPALLRRLRRQLEDVDVRVLYGPTEATVLSSSRHVPVGPEGDAVLDRLPPGGSLGRALPGVRLSVRDRLGRLLPVGLAGELVIEGTGVTRGYRGRAKLTAEVFVPEFTSDLPHSGARAYRSGDRVRWREDSQGEIELEFLGRVDQQVKVRGFRIEPRGIEAVLEAHEQVERAVVAVRMSTPSEGEEVAELAAWVIVGQQDWASDLVERLRSHVAERLPSYMVPTHLDVLDALPLTAHGKVDRKALLARPGSATPEKKKSKLRLKRDKSRADPQQADVAPLALELSVLFAEVLGVDSVDPHDDFFQLGGHSVLVMRLAGLLRSRLDRDLPLRAIFDAPTAVELAAVLEQAEESRPEVASLEESRSAVAPVAAGTGAAGTGAAGTGAAGTGAAERGDAPTTRPPLAPRSRPAESEGGVPLSFAQERLWFLAQLDHDSALYNVPMALELRSEVDSRDSGASALDIGAFVGAVHDVVRRHEVLRTSYPTVAGRPRQAIAPVPSSAAAAGYWAGLAYVDLAGLDIERARSQRDRLARLEAKRPFDLEQGPVMRVVLVRTDVGVHTLLLTLHHIASDGWSTGVFVRDFSAFYQARLGSSTRTSEGPPPLRVQYADYALWQRAWLDERALTAEIEHWREVLAELPPALDLPTDHPRPPVQTHHGEFVPASLPAPLVTALDELARRSGATLFMVLLTAFQALLGRTAGQRRVAVGTPVAGRHHEHLDDLIGFFINTLVLSTDLSRQDGDEPTFETLLRRTRSAVLDAYEHQDVPFERLVAELAPRRDLARPALFQAMFALQTAPSETLRLPGSTLAPVSSGTGNAKFELTLTLTPVASGALVGSLGFNADLFDASTMARLADRLRRLLDTVAADSAVRPAQVELIGDAERHQLLREWRAVATFPSPQPGMDLASRIRQHAERQPEAIAVRQYGQGVEMPLELTWGALLERAEEQAAALRARSDWSAEARVAICRRRSPQVVIDWLSVLLAGGVYVPLDPVHPEERLRLQVDDAEAVTVLSDGALASGDSTTVESPSLLPSLFTSPSPSPLPNGLAYVVYTSGSTGVPKGVAVPHRALSSMVDWKLRIDALGPGDRVAFASGLSFDAAATDVWPSLAAGATLCLPTPVEEAEPARMLDWLLVSGLHVARLGTPMAEALLDLPLPPLARHTLRTLVTGGDRLRKLPPAAWRGVLFNRYGPSESTVQVSRYQVADGRGQSGLPTLGRPVDATALWVLDARQRLQPIGVPGELVIASRKLARGYLGRPGQTAAAFRPNPFADAESDAYLGAGSRIYRSGDLARALADGELEFLGRIDHQVQLRGYRVELGEIEMVLTDHASVAQAVVLLRDGLPGGEGLVAYVESAAQGPADLEATLRDYLRSRLPLQMLPAALVFVDAMPVTPNGKFDRAALLALPLGRALSQPAEETDSQPMEQQLAQLTAPPGDLGVNALEQRLIEIWRRLLGVERVRRSDNFFDLGGHSLLLIELQHHIRDELDVEVPVVELFQFPTIASLAQHLGAHRGGGEDGAPAGAGAEIAAVTRFEPLQPSLDAAGPVAIIGMAGRFPGAPDLDAFWQVLENGVETVSRFTREELLAQGVAPEELDDPDYVPARGRLQDLELFDADFFDYAPREAQVLDPQFRLFLELAWHALEDAGYDPTRARRPGGPGRVAVFGGGAAGTYRWHFGAHPEVVSAVGSMQVNYATNPQFLPTQVAYKLGLEGPAINVQTACSTGLVSLHLACQALADGSCDMALAGGVAADTLGVRGYKFQVGGISAKDGHCRSYDARATGSVMSNGAGLVLLKPLSAAERDGDRVLAVVLGSALNNDGHRKVGYTAPSVEGQAEAIRSAHRRAGIEPATIQFVEGHGSATPLGDPVEVRALQLAFGPPQQGEARSIVLSSVKSNQGHADTAAGIAGLIKTVLALRHRQLPPTVHFEQANPAMGIDDSRFEVRGELSEWPQNHPLDGDALPRRAGVSSFGIGGTNAHVVVEEALPVQPRQPAWLDDEFDPWRLLVLSARSEASSVELRQRWVEALEQLDADPVAFEDWSYTALVGRAGFELRHAFVARDAADAVEVLRGAVPGRLVQGVVERGAQPAVAFLLAGVGDQYPGMAAGLYQHEPVFRAAIDRCAEVLEARLDLDLRQVLFPEGVEAYLPSASSAAAGADQGATTRGPDLRALLGRSRRPSTPLDQTRYLQPAVFAVDYALAQLWQSWGVTPSVLLGYSLGEYVAACLAGVLSLEAALTLVAERARLLEALPAGAMLAVSLPEARLRPLLTPGVEVSAINGPELCVVGGSSDAIDSFAAHLDALAETEHLEEPVAWRRLATSHAFHTSHMQAAASDLRRVLEGIDLRPPQRPYLSNVTGTWARPDEVTDPDYWLRHLVQPVRFADALAELWRTPGLADGGVVLEIGPGQGLGSLALQQAPPEAASAAVFASLRSASEAGPATTGDRAFALETLAKLWTSGVEVDARGLFHLPSPTETDSPSSGAADLLPRRARLPLYPFDRQRYWLEAPSRASAQPSPLVMTGEAAMSTGVAADSPPIVETRAKALQSIRRRPGQAAYVEPASALQQRLAAVWGDLLGVEGVGLHDSFFELGGHSLLGTRLLARLRSELEVDLDLAGLFANPTVEGQAARIEELAPGIEVELPASTPVQPADDVEPQRLSTESSSLIVQESPTAVVNEAGDAEPLPLSYAQERMWFLHRLDPASPAYNIPAVYRVLGVLRADLCARALALVVERQAILRTRYVLDRGDSLAQTSQHRDETFGGEPRQIADLAFTPPPLIDLRELARRDRRAEARRLASREVVRPFDLETGPVYRFTLVRHGADEHSVLVTVHHIGADGWSLGVFIREFATAYDAVSRGHSLAVPMATLLPPLPWQYSDFALWQRRWLADRLEQQLDYWREQLAAVPVLELPTDRPRPSGGVGLDARGRRRERFLPSTLLADVRELARRGVEGAPATDFVVLLAAFQALLARWRLPQGAVPDGAAALHADIAVGTPVAGRRQLETEPLIGFFVNTLVLRRQFDLGQGLLTHVADARRVALGAFDHQDVPFERLVDELQPERNLRTTPLFQVLFALQNAPPPSATSPGLRLAHQPYEATTVRFDFEVSLYPARQEVVDAQGEAAVEDALILSIGYRTALFDATTVDRFARAFEVLLRGVLAEPERPLIAVPLLVDAERHQVLVEAQESLLRPPSRHPLADTTIDVVFRDVAARYPDAIAMHFGQRHFSYAMLDRQSDLQAAWLAEQFAALPTVATPAAATPADASPAGPQPTEPIVGLRLDRTPEFFLAMLACVKAGAAYLPLDPQYPEERVAYMLEDAGASVTLTPDTSPELGNSHAPEGDHIGSPLHGGREGCGVPGTGVRVPSPLSAAYLLYTSGSTGRPKGVLIPHRGVLRLVLDNPFMPFAVRPRVSQMNNTAFDVTTAEVWGTWLNGGTLVGVPRAISQDANAVPEYLHRYGVEMAMIPSALFAHLVRTRPGVLDGIAYINIGGEAADDEACRTFLARSQGRQLGHQSGRLLNGYGPTECTVYSQVEILYPSESYARQSSFQMTIGRPVPYTDSVVLPAGGPVTWHEPLPIGVAGELCLGGPRLARGYHRRPSLTAERFIPHPFPHCTSDRGARLYRTGDLVRLLPDGRYDYLGRLDHQIQLRGFRVELGEIESVLRAVEGVEEAVVLVRGEGDGRHLVAYVLAPSNEPESLARACLDAARSSLPDYMEPRHIVPLDELPLNPNGKIDRARLAQLEPADAGTGIGAGMGAAMLDRTAPRDEVEALLARVWARLLEVEQVGVHGNFFQLGGHSLLAASLLAETETAFDVQISLAAFFEQPTVAALARRVRQARERRVAVGDAYGKTLLRRPPLVALDRDEFPRDEAGRPILPQSYAQQRLWFLDRLEPGLSTYHIAVPLRFRGQLDVAGLHATLDGIFARHEALRTTFAQQGAEAIQIIHPPPRSGQRQPLPLIDLGGLGVHADAPRVERELERLAAAEARRPFDLEADPMLRVVLVRLPPVLDSSAPEDAAPEDAAPEDAEAIVEHGVLVTLHHIASDGWSVGVLVNDVASLYQAWVTGAWQGQDRRPLPAVQVQYGDYAIWQRRWLETVAPETEQASEESEKPNSAPPTVLDRQLDYWRAQLAGAPTLDLPLDRPRPPRFETSGGQVSRILPAQLKTRLDTLAASSGNTLFVTLLTAFEVLMLRWTGSHDISVGTPVAGRTRVEVEPLIGFFVNTLVLRGQLDPEAPFAQALAQLRKVVLAGQDHGDVPFERVVEALQPPRDRSRTPLFQVLFTLQTTATGRLDLPGLDLRAVPLRSGVAKFDLEVQAQPYLDPTAPRDPDGQVEPALLLTAGYRSRLFDSTTIERLLGHFEVLLRAIAEASQTARTPLSRLPLLSAAEHHQLVVEANDTERSFPHASLATLLRDVAERQPDAIALQYPVATAGTMLDHYVGYRELVTRAERLAGQLRQQGVGPNVLVGLDLERSPELIIATVAVILAGGAYLPLNRNYPEERLRFQLQDAGAHMVVGEGGALTPVSPAGEGCGAPGTGVRAPDPLDLAYTLYTSGSTGRPKGVAVTQRGVARLLLGVSYMEYGPERRICQIANFGFDAATFEVWGALLHGGCIVGVPRDLSLDPGRLARYFASRRVDAACFTSALFHQLVRSHPEAFASLRDLLVGGEAVDPEAAHLLLSGAGSGFRGRLSNAYGPTECSVIATVGAVTVPDTVALPDASTGHGARAHGRLSIGRPIANTEVYLLDLHGELVVPGVPGELLLGGPGLARGYQNRPELTAEAFVPHPWSTVPGHRLYRTGDLVRRLHDGRLDFLGRRDHQVKLRGFRIELGEVEMVLRAQPEVEDAVVLVRGEGDGRYLVAYVVPASPASSGNVEELRPRLAATLPDYMVPRYLVPLEAFPLTPNRKLDRRALPDPDTSRQDTYVAPRTELEEDLAELWADLLAVERVGVEDDFFELGGHSMLAMQLMSELEGSLGFPVPLERLFSQPTVAGLARVLEELDAAQEE